MKTHTHVRLNEYITYTIVINKSYSIVHHFIVQQYDRRQCQIYTQELRRYRCNIQHTSRHTFKNTLIARVCIFTRPAIESVVSSDFLYFNRTHARTHARIAHAIFRICNESNEIYFSLCYKSNESTFVNSTFPHILTDSHTLAHLNRCENKKINILLFRSI